MDESFGFQHNMNDVVWSLCEQSSKICFLISACENVHLQIQKDLQLADTEKRQRFDKSQVARRTVSAEDLIKCVVANEGNSGLEVIKKLLARNRRKNCSATTAVQRFTSKGLKPCGEPSPMGAQGLRAPPPFPTNFIDFPTRRQKNGNETHGMLVIK